MTDETPEVHIEDLQLDDVVSMDPADLTETHKEFLESNKGSLTVDQQSKFGFGDETPPTDDSETPPATTPPVTPPEAPVEPVTKKPIEMEFGDDEDDDMDAEDRERIRKQVAKGSKSVIERQQLIEDTQAINNIIIDSPELKPYKELALKYMKAHPTLVAADAMKIASAGYQQKIGAEKERIAAERAKKTQNPGSQHRSSNTGTKDWNKATTEEVEAQIARAKGQRI